MEVSIYQAFLLAINSNNVIVQLLVYRIAKCILERNREKEKEEQQHHAHSSPWTGD
jgi:hypothetical protein